MIFRNKYVAIREKLHAEGKTSWVNTP